LEIAAWGLAAFIAVLDALLLFALVHKLIGLL
jgi:hypothetical protein